MEARNASIRRLRLREHGVAKAVFLANRNYRWIRTGGQSRARVYKATKELQLARVPSKAHGPCLMRSIHVC